MNTDINIKKIYIIPLILLFLPAFSLYFVSKPILLFFIAITISFSIHYILKPGFFSKHVSKLYNNTSFKNFIFWFLWVIVSGFILVCLGKYSPTHFIYYIVLYLFINMTLPLLLPTIIISDKKSLNKLIKFIIGAIYIVLILGILNFIGSKFDINIINTLFSNIVNIREWALKGTVSVYKAKVYSVFAEPGYFGSFICLILPIIFACSSSKYKLYKNNIINIVIKKTILPLAIIDVILTRSPIWLIFCFIVFCYLVSPNIKKAIKKNKLKFIVSFISILLIIVFGVNKINNSVYTESMENKYLSRITNTLQAIKNLDYDLFITIEPSLASRVSSYINSLRLFMHYPITGIGLGNSKFYMMEYFKSSPVPLTIENLSNMQTTNNIMMFNGALLYELLSETGFFGCFLYYYFIFITYKRLKYKLNYFSGIEKDFLIGLSNIYPIILFICSIYDVCLNNIHLWFLLGISIGACNKKIYMYKEIASNDEFISNNTNI